MLPIQKKRIYKSYHACFSAAQTQIILERQPEFCCSEHYNVVVPREDVRQRALKMTAERYHVTTSEVSHIVRELRIPNATPKRQVEQASPKRIHKRK
jgi:hypothetical protein